MASLTGSPPTYQFVKPPSWDYASILYQYLAGLMNQPAPTYPGNIDPGMSPTMGSLGQMTQTYSTSPLPAILGQAQGTLGRFMSPSFANPVARMQFGAPSYFGFNPGQKMYGGSTMGGFPSLGMSGPMGQGGGMFPGMGMPPGMMPPGMMPPGMMPPGMMPPGMGPPQFPGGPGGPSAPPQMGPPQLSPPTPPQIMPGQQAPPKDGK